MQNDSSDMKQFETEERILTETKKKKPESNQIYEEFSKATVKIRNKKWEMVKELRAQVNYATLAYGKIYTTS